MRSYSSIWPTPTRHRGVVAGNSHIFSLAVSPDGGLVAASTGGGLVRLFDPTKGELIESLHGHLNAVFGLNFSADGRRLISEGGAAGGDQALGCRHAAGTADFGGYRLSAPRCPVDRRWRRDPRRSAVAGLAGTVLEGNRRGGGEGHQRGRAAVNATSLAGRRALPRAPGERQIGDPHDPRPTSDVEDDPVGGRDRFRLELVLVGPPAFGQRHVLEQTDEAPTGLAGVSRQEHAARGSVIGGESCLVRRSSIKGPFPLPLGRFGEFISKNPLRRVSLLQRLTGGG